MTSIEELTREHELILRVLDAFDAYAERLALNEESPRALASFCLFVTRYLDGVHNASEEAILFRALRSFGFARDTGPVAAMLSEHDHGRTLITALAESSNETEWTAGERHEVVGRIAAFTRLMRTHIAKENRVLYPLAQRVLTEPVIAEIDAEHARLARLQAGRKEELEAIAAGLCDRYKPIAA